MSDDLDPADEVDTDSVEVRHLMAARGWTERQAWAFLDADADVKHAQAVLREALARRAHLHRGGAP